MNKYIPFLKLKQGEIGAIREMHSSLKGKLSVFFDVPRKKTNEATPKNYKALIDKYSKSVLKHCSALKDIYIDVFDVPADIRIGEAILYDYALQEFSPIQPIPVIGIDRSPDHIEVALKYASKNLCLRVQPDDFDSFELFLESLYGLIDKSILKELILDIVFDCRYSANHTPKAIADQIVQFRKAAIGKLMLRRTIVCGSTIPVSISSILKTGEEMMLSRIELQIFDEVTEGIDIKNLYLGDYTIIAPLFTEIDIPPEMMQNFITPRVIYPVNNEHFILRGGSLKTHERKSLQYNDFCERLIGEDFYRGEKYSWGDNFFRSKANHEGSKVTPGSIIKPGINAHITYMLLR